MLVGLYLRMKLPSHRTDVYLVVADNVVVIGLGDASVLLPVALAGVCSLSA